MDCCWNEPGAPALALALTRASIYIKSASRGSRGTAGGWQLLTPQSEYQASDLILAAGARNPFRSQFLSPISPDDLMVTAGYFIPGRSSLMQIQFLQGITGYIWVFPRAGSCFCRNRGQDG